MTKDEILAVLREGVVTLEFTKLDGEARVMECTLSENIIPKTSDVKEQTPEAAKRKTPTTSLAVWDIDKHGWRSFRWESLFRFNGQDVKVASE